MALARRSPLRVQGVGCPPAQVARGEGGGSRIALSSTRAQGNPTMGDKSPKAMRKQADQKQTKTNEDNRKKEAVATAKQVAPKKK
jgi:hypothetical protein